MARDGNDKLAFRNTNRGFSIADFVDRYGERRSLQRSSLAAPPCVWLGVHDNRMHLTQAHVRALLPALICFAETGELPMGGAP